MPLLLPFTFTGGVPVLDVDVDLDVDGGVLLFLSPDAGGPPRLREAEIPSWSLF